MTGNTVGKEKERVRGREEEDLSQSGVSNPFYRPRCTQLSPREMFEYLHILAIPSFPPEAK
jgi:hypothetical protein